MSAISMAPSLGSTSATCKSTAAPVSGAPRVAGLCGDSFALRNSQSSRICGWMLERFSLFLTVCSLGAASLPEGVSDTQNALDKPLAPSEVLKKIQVPDGFNVTLFAAEPDLFQPVAFDF